MEAAGEVTARDTLHAFADGHRGTTVGVVSARDLNTSSGAWITDFGTRITQGRVRSTAVYALVVDADLTRRSAFLIGGTGVAADVGAESTVVPRVRGSVGSIGTSVGRGRVGSGNIVIRARDAVSGAGFAGAPEGTIEVAGTTGRPCFHRGALTAQTNFSADAVLAGCAVSTGDGIGVAGRKSAPQNYKKPLSPVTHAYLTDSDHEEFGPSVRHR